MLKDFELDPFEGNIFAGIDDVGENFYFIIHSIFDFEEETYVSFYETVDELNFYLGKIEFEEGSSTFSVEPVKAGELFDKLSHEFAEYCAINEIE